MDNLDNLSDELGVLIARIKNAIKSAAALDVVGAETRLASTERALAKAELAVADVEIRMRSTRMSKNQNDPEAAAAAARYRQANVRADQAGTRAQNAHDRAQAAKAVAAQNASADTIKYLGLKKVKKAGSNTVKEDRLEAASNMLVMELEDIQLRLRSLAERHIDGN